MPKNVSLVLMAVCFVVTILFAGSASPVRAASDTIQTYSDPDLSIPATVFADGMPVYFTASDGATAGGTKTATVSNGTETVSMTVYDDGTHPDQTADDGVYTGHFRVSTIMTIDVPSRPDQPKIVDCIYLKEGQNATITVDLDGGGDSGTKQVQLVTLFEVDAVAVRDDSATIVWTTSIPATSWMEYGLDASYGNLSTVDTTHRLHHRILLEGLTPGVTYHYRVLSQDVYSDTHVSADQVFSTTTTAELEALIQAARTSGDLPQTYYVGPDGDDDNNSGLTIEDAWQHIAYAVQQADVGDTIYVLPGTYTGEHVEFERSGIDVAPIRLLAHSSQPVLDGVDSTGIAIQMRDKSFIEIAGLRIVNYGTGIRGRGLVQHLHIHDFEMENMDEDGLDFDSGTSVQNCRFTDFGMNEISLNSGTAVTHFDYSSTDTYNVEIANFTITNAHGEAINWRNSRRVHIHHGTITNSGSDALHYQLNVHCSVASDLHVENTGWHGIAIHDHTVGDHPCYNNLIRNCYVYGAQHNDVDLHSGAFNTIVEDCHLDGPPATGQGLYFHNLGAGLIARKNTIHDTGDGIDGGPSDGEFLTDIIVEDNTLYNCSGIMWQGATENVIIRGNVLYDTTYSTPIHAYRNNILIEKNDIEEGKTYRISAGDGRIIDALDELYHARTAYGADVSVGYTDGRVFERELVYHSGPYTLTEPLWYPDGSRFQMTSTTGENGITVKITPYPMTAVPSADEATVTVNKFDTSLPVGKVLVDFTADSTDEITVTFTISDLTSYEDYAVNRDGSLLAMPTASDAGIIQFSNSDWYTACTFTVTRATTKPTVTSHSPSGIFVPLPPTFSITFSEPMSRTATEGAISISGGMSPTGFAWSDGDRTVDFVSSASLIYATTYTVTVSTAAADLEDEHLPVPYSWQFTTQPEVMWQVYLPLVTKSFY